MRYLKIIWICAAIAVLTASLYFFDGKPNSDVDVFLTWAMLALSFPIGIACSLIFAGLTYGLYNLAAITISTSYAWILFSWFVFFIAGYWQWFILVPKWSRKFRKKEA